DEKGGGKLSVRIRHDAEAGQLRLRVEDTGPGISDDARGRLFQPFFTTKAEGVGTGLGLSICRQIMAEHGGAIEVESPLGRDGGALVKRIVLTALITAAFIAAGAFVYHVIFRPQEDRPTWTLATYTGGVDVSLAGGAWRPAEMKMALTDGDRLRTSSDGEV